VELDPSLAEPHATLGLVAFFYKWAWIEADRELRRAISIDAGYATAHQWFSLFLNCMGKSDPAIHEAQLAAELEPLSLLLNVNYADILYFAERYDEAMAHVRKTLEVESYFLAHLLIGRIYTAQKMYPEALASIETAIAMEGRYPELVASLGYIYGMMGQNKKARAILAELKSIAEKEFVAPVFLAEVCLALGDYDKALEYAEEFFRMRGELAELLVGPRFAALRRDYRFGEMLERVGFPDRSVLTSPAFAPTATL
jgi:tetratricopeptide (TPR) repeat protein